MLSYRSTWEFVRTLEKCGEALRCASCFSTLLSCSYKFSRASISQHSTLMRALFLYYSTVDNTKCQVQCQMYNVIVWYRTRLLTGLGKLVLIAWHDNLNKLFVQLKGSWLTGCFFNQSKYSDAHYIPHRLCILLAFFCSDIFTKFTIETDNTLNS